MEKGKNWFQFTVTNAYSLYFRHIHCDYGHAKIFSAGTDSCCTG